MNTKAGKVRYDEVVLFPHPYEICLVTSEDEWDQVMNDWKVRDRREWLMEGAYGQVHELERGQRCLLVVCLRTQSRKIEEIAGILAHEATHCFQAIARYMNEHTPSKELQAYAIQMITLALLNQYKQKKKKK